MRKNVASQVIGAQMVSASDGSAFTGTVTVYVTGNAGTQALGTVGSGVCTHEGNGFHTYAPSQAETNFDHIAFTFVGTGAIPVTVQVYTRFDANVSHINTAAAATPGASGGLTICGSNAATTFASLTSTGAFTIGSFSCTGNFAIGNNLSIANSLSAGGNVLPWNAAWDAEVQSKCNDALVANNLDHLVLSAVDTNFNTTVHANSVIGHLASTNNTYDRSTDSQEAIRNRGDSAWITATGFSTFDYTTDLVTLVSAYDPAKTAAQPGDEMDLVDAPNATAIAAIQSGLSTFDHTLDAVGVGAFTVGALAQFFTTDSEETYADAVAGSVVKEIVENAGGGGGLTAADVWTYTTRTLTSIDEDTVTLDLDTTIRAAVGLSSADLDAQLDAIPTANENADALLDRANGIETGYTPRQCFRIIVSAVAGKSSGHAANSPVYRDVNDLKNRIMATTTGDGRTAVTLDAT